MMNNEINQNTNQTNNTNPIQQRNLDNNKPINFKSVISIVAVVFLVGAFIITNFYLKEDKVDILNTDIENKTKSNPTESIYRPPINYTEKSVNVTESEDNKTTNTIDVDEDETSANEEIKIVYGIAVKDFNVYRHEKSSLAETAKVEIKNDSIILTTYGIPKEPSSITHKVSNVTKAVASCDGCGSGCYLYYINNNNELHEINFDYDGKDTLIKNSVKDIETDYIKHDGFCIYDTVVITNTDNTKSVYSHGFSTYLPYNEMNREYFLTIDDNSGDENQHIFIANPSAKADMFLKDDKGNVVYAKAVAVVDNKYIYIIDENNSIYYYNNVINNQKGTLYKNTKVKSYEEFNDGLNITYEDGNTEALKGDIFIK